jgi:SAM-dependent methyltransferase
MLFRFLRRSHTDPLHVSMMGVRMGERFLQIGCDDQTLLSGLATKVGLSGNAAVAVPDDVQAHRAERAGIDAGVLLDLQRTALTALPFDPDAFDIVVVDDTVGRFAALAPGDRLGAMREALRVLRQGGRIGVVEGLGGGRLRRPIARPEGYAADALLRDGGFRPVRLLAERERYRFYEGLKPTAPNGG